MDPNAGKAGSRSSSHRHSSSHSGPPPGSHHRPREERPLGSENSYDSSGRLTNMSHATSVASDRYRYSTGPPGSGQRQWEWIEAQQGMSRENYSSSIDSRIEGAHGSESQSHHPSGEGSRSGSHARSGSGAALNSPPSGLPPRGSHHTESNRSGPHHSAPGSYENGSQHNSRSHHTSSGAPYNEPHQSSHNRSGPPHANTISPLMHEPGPSGSGSRSAHEPRAHDRKHRDIPGRNKYREGIQNNPNQRTLCSCISAMSHKICYSMGKPRPEEKEKRRKK